MATPFPSFSIPYILSRPILPTFHTHPTVPVGFENIVHHRVHFPLRIHVGLPSEREPVQTQIAPYVPERRLHDSHPHAVEKSPLHTVDFVSHPLALGFRFLRQVPPFKLRHLPRHPTWILQTFEPQQAHPIIRHLRHVRRPVMSFRRPEIPVLHVQQFSRRIN